MNDSTTRFAIMGSGGVGGYFGARLHQAGFPVTFVARGKHLEAMLEAGLCVETPEETIRIAASATDDPATIGPVDYVLFSVKCWDTESAAKAIKPLLGKDTAVVSLQNGVDSESTLCTVLGASHVMGGVAELSAFIEGPGVIRKMSGFHLIRYGELDGRESQRALVLEKCLKKAGIDVDRSTDIQSAIWKKFIFLVGLSALTAVTRSQIGAIREDPDTRRLLEQIMQEAFDVARAQGIRLDDDTLKERLKFIDSLPPTMRASMALDLDSGHRLELPWLSGAVVRIGGELNIPTPANQFICAALKFQVNGANNR